MWRVGFGFEKLGLWALKWPGLFSVLLFLFSLICVINVSNLQFNGSIISVLPDQSKAFHEYEAIKDEFGNFSRDVTILVESEDLLTAEGMEALRDLQLDISLSDSVSNAVSIFSVPEFDPHSGALLDWFPERFESDDHARTLVQALIQKYPQAARLIDPQRQIAVIVATLQKSVEENGHSSYQAYHQLQSDALAAAPEGFSLQFTGLTPIADAIMNAIISDQVNLILFGLLLGTFIAYVIFRNFLAALLCAIPPVLTALWVLGLFSVFGISINYLTTILPSLALILAFADGIFLYYRWQTLNAANNSPAKNLEEAIIRVGPASSLTSITTALAFLSFLYAESGALKEFAFLGAGAVSMAFGAVIIGLPLAIHWSIRLGIVNAYMHQEPALQKLGKRIKPTIIGHPWIWSAVGLSLVALFAYIQKDMTAEYRLVQYMPPGSDVRSAEELANEITGGRAIMSISVPFVQEKAQGERQQQGLSNPQNLERLQTVDGLARSFFGKEVVFSAMAFLENHDSAHAKSGILALIDDPQQSSSRSLISKSRDASIITVRMSSDLPVAQSRELINGFRKKLTHLEYVDDIIVSGFPVLMSIEFTNLIEQLRVSLLLAIAFGVIFLGIATRSFVLFLAALTPNLLPILFLLAMLYLRGGTINMSEVVALTMAFGIAIDNAVHLINVYVSQQDDGNDCRHALAAALEEVGPALTAGSTIICVALLVTQMSSLPMVPLLGRLMIAALVMALVSNLLILPANILTLEGIKQRFKKQ